jgi:hypothetical protein
MQMAVSILSPVSIQILIPAFLIFSRLVAILSYSLSSTPVTPRNSISLSIIEMTFLTASFLPSNYSSASVSFLAQF